MKKKRYLMIVYLLSSPNFFINVEASDGGSSSAGVEFCQNPRTPAPKDASSRTDAPTADPKEPTGPPKEGQRSDGLTQATITGLQLPRTGSRSWANPNILGLTLIGLAGMIHREKE